MSRNKGKDQSGKAAERRKRPSKYMFALLSQVAAGAATLDEIMPILRERERRKELGRASAARRRAKKEAESQ